MEGIRSISACEIESNLFLNPQEKEQEHALGGHTGAVAKAHYVSRQNQLFPNQESDIRRKIEAEIRAKVEAEIRRKVETQMAQKYGRHFVTDDCLFRWSGGSSFPLSVLCPRETLVNS